MASITRLVSIPPSRLATAGLASAAALAFAFAGAPFGAFAAPPKGKAGKAASAGDKAKGDAPDAAAAATETPPVVRPAWGDSLHGRFLFEANCTVCHGPQGNGDGAAAGKLPARPTDLTAPERMLRYDDAALASYIAGGGKSVGGSPASPGFADALGALDTNDLVAYLRSMHPTVESFFPAATRYVVKDYALPDAAVTRLEKVLRRKLDDAERKAAVVTVFRGGKPGASGPRLVGQDARALAELRRSDKLGYVAFASLRLPGAAGRTPMAAFGLSPEYAIQHLDVRDTSTPAVADAARKYKGLGTSGRPELLKAPAGVSAAHAEAIADAYLRAVEAATAYVLEERDRTWADEDF